MSPDERVARIAERQYGLITTKQLRAAGLDPWEVQYRWRVGRLRRESRGVYRLPGGQFSVERKLLAAQFATRSSVLSHRSAGVLWKIKGVALVRPEIIIPIGTSTSIDGLIAYRRRLPMSDVTMRGPFRLTTPSRTLCDLASIVDATRLEVAVDDSVTRGITDLDALRARVDGERRGVTGVRVLRAIVEDRVAHGTPASYLETTALHEIRRAGLGRPLSQHEIRGPSGDFVARPDLAYPELRLAIELDGDRYHAGKAQRQADLARQNRLTLAGWTFLRFCDADVRRGGMIDSLRTYLHLLQTDTHRTERSGPGEGAASGSELGTVD